MNDHAELIRAALERRYARLAVPTCPDTSWRIENTMPAANAGAPARSRTFANVAAALVLIAIAGLGASASALIAQTYMRFMPPVSTKPLPPMIHAADRLTIAEAQRRVPFAIVLPKGLPEQTRFDYAEVAAARGKARVSLLYQTPIAHRYYRLVFGESTVEGPPSIPVELTTRDGISHRYYLPVRRWRHDPIFISLVTPGVSDDISDRIVRANSR